METIATFAVLALLAILYWRFVIPWLARLSSPPPFENAEKLRQRASQLRDKLRTRGDGHLDRKTGELHEQLGHVMAGLSLISIDDKALVEAIASWRQAADVFRAVGMNEQCTLAEFNLAVHLCELGARSVHSDGIREGERLLTSVLKLENAELLRRYTLEFCQATRANVLAELGERLGDNQLLQDALRLCSTSRSSLVGSEFKPPAPAADGVAGETLTVIGRELNDRSILADATEATRRAMGADDNKGSPIMLAAALCNHGRALATLGEFDRNREMLMEAINFLDDALNCLDPEVWPVSWVGAQVQRGCALTALGTLMKNSDKLSLALESHRDALALLDRGDAAPFVRAQALNFHGESLLAWASLTSDSSFAADALESHREAEAILQDGDLAGSLGRIRRNIAAAEALACC